MLKASMKFERFLNQSKIIKISLLWRYKLYRQV